MITLKKLPKAGPGKILIREIDRDELKDFVVDNLGIITLENMPMTLGKVVGICPTVEKEYSLEEGDVVSVSRMSRSEDRRIKFDGSDYSLIVDPRMINFKV